MNNRENQLFVGLPNAIRLDRYPLKFAPLPTRAPMYARARAHVHHGWCIRARAKPRSASKPKPLGLWLIVTSRASGGPTVSPPLTVGGRTDGSFVCPGMNTRRACKSGGGEGVWRESEFAFGGLSNCSAPLLSARPVSRVSGFGFYELTTLVAASSASPHC